MANIALIVRLWFIFQMLLHTLVFTRLLYHGPLLNPTIFDEINLFQKKIANFCYFVSKKETSCSQVVVERT
jgi:hypothetical protein